MGPVSARVRQVHQPRNEHEAGPAQLSFCGTLFLSQLPASWRLLLCRTHPQNLHTAGQLHHPGLLAIPGQTLRPIRRLIIGFAPRAARPEIPQMGIGFMSAAASDAVSLRALTSRGAGHAPLLCAGRESSGAPATPVSCSRSPIRDDVARTRVHGS